MPQPPQPPSVGGELPPRPALRPAGGYVYKDPPRYPVIASYEGRLKDNYRRSLAQMNRALVAQLRRYQNPEN